MGHPLNVGTFNIRGLNSNLKKQALDEDLVKYKMDIICLQETKIKEGIDINLENSRLITFPTEKGHYGNGFIIKKDRSQEIHRVWKVDERICVMQMKDKNSKLISIINVYGPTSMITKEKPEVRDQFYEKLENIIKIEEKKAQLILLAGDFNSKVGKMQTEDISLGHFSKGKRNENGEALVNFCEANGLYLINTKFQHPSRHQTTWQGQCKIKDKVVPIYNQIDFIICKRKDRPLFQDARSYAGTAVSSDHRLVKAKLTTQWWRMKREKHEKNIRIDTYRLIEETEIREAYKINLQKRMETEPLDKKKTPQENWENIKKAVNEAALETAGEEKPTKQANRIYNEELNKKSIEQKKIRMDINSCQDNEKKKKLQEKRNRIQREISKKALQIRNEEIDRQVEEIEAAGEASKMFKAVGKIFREKYENPKVEDEEGKMATDPNKILELTTEFFKEKFNKPEAQGIDPYKGEKRPLNKPITKDEVKKSFKKLNNGRATGEDGIKGELLKYGPETLAEHTASVFNSAFEKHEPLEINNGNMRTLPKPGKPKGPRKNLRPVTLLNTVRKTLSLITLDRIKEKVDTYLSANQSGFRPFRSTADVVWTHRWLAAKTALSDIDIKITGIDMSSAFDTIDRKRLLEILETFLEEDEIRLIQFLLSNTHISIKVSGATTELPFLANVGTPQGDSLSPVLFIIYLEAALKEVRELPDQKEPHLPTEVAYADDVDFVSTIKHKDIRQVQEVLAKYNLLVNEEKTEYTKIKRESKKEEESWRKVKKVGSLLGDEEDIERRKKLATVVMNKMDKIWIRKDKISKKRKLNLYRALVKSILLYNCGTWGVTKAEENKLDAFHRKQLKRILGIKYPKKISNKNLYRETKEKPISETMREARWKLLGHILRRPEEIPANMAMIFYYNDGISGKKFKGARRTTLPEVLNSDLEKLQNEFQHLKDHNYCARLKLRTREDLDTLKNVARNRKLWRALVHRVIGAGRADWPFGQSA